MSEKQFLDRKESSILLFYQVAELVLKQQVPIGFTKFDIALDPN